MKKCLFCGKEFEPVNANQLYCSAKCRKSVNATCTVCGKKITPYKNKAGIYFCSRKCAAIYSGKTIEKYCPVCGKKYTTKASTQNYGWGKYCSKDCANKAMQVEHYSVCKQCGKVFLVTKGRGTHQKFCSKSCMKEGFRKPIDKNLLYRLYVDEELTTAEIGQIIGRSGKVVRDYLKYYGIHIRPDGIKNRDRIKCTDGHLVRSYYERSFDNLLHRNGIEHEYDPRLPFNRRCMADFKVSDVYVEVWGLMSIKHYREQREKKIQMYRENGCKLLEIFPDDFKNIQNKLYELESLINL